MSASVRALLRGQPLRLRPIALRRSEQHPVRVALEAAGRHSDVTRAIFPAALEPLTIAFYGDAPAQALRDHGACRLRFEDIVDSAVVGWIAIEPDAPLATPETPISLVRPTRSAIPCEAAIYRTWRHFLAWRHTRAGAVSDHNLQMSYPDLRALNVFYVLPRPVFLVSVEWRDRANMFPMDLVAPVGGNDFMLALRRTSPSVETMCESRRLVISAAPAALKEIAYRLGAHHREATINWSSLPFAVTASLEYRIPRLAESPIVRELYVEAFHSIGSHMLFSCRVISQETPTDVPQLCHVSDMYARWRRRRGRAFADA